MAGGWQDGRAISRASLALFAVAVFFLGVVFFSEERSSWARALAIACFALAAALAWLGLHHLLHNASVLAEAERRRADAAIEEERRRADAAIEEERRHATAAIESAREDARQASEDASAERARRDTAERRHEEMQRYALELRTRIRRLTENRGPLGASEDIPALVLRIAVELLDGAKGLLLARDGDGLELLAAEGFENDPKESRLVKRFATSVMRKDETIRENEAADYDATPADREIDNLVAIPMFMHDDFTGVVVVANKPGGFERDEDEVLLALGDHAGSLLQNARLHGDLRAAYLATVRILANALEAKDPFLRGHSNEVSAYVAAVARDLDIDERRREELVFASLLHDLGKIGISERILLKPAALSPEEYNVVKLHPRIGSRLIEQVPSLENMASAVLYHHERWDGTGYPDGLRGEEIPLEARVVAVADAFSAMTSDRPYRGRMGLEDALTELERNAGTQFDPEVVRLFCNELRARPPAGEAKSELAVALSDAQLEVRIGEDEPVLGYGAHAIIDHLTLLYSHRYIHEMVRAEAERAAVQGVGFSVLMAELGDISKINETLGYAAGDAAIRRLAQAMQRLAVTCGGTAARYGGPRIALLMPKTDPAEAERCARELTASLPEDLVVRVETASWEPGESGARTLLRAREAVARKTTSA